MNCIAYAKFGASLLTLFAAQAAWACLSPPPVGLNPAPTGPEGQLPLIKPVVALPGYYNPDDPDNPPCPVPGRYGDEAPMPSLSDAEYQVLFHGAPPLPAAWDAGKAYQTGDTVSYDKQVWRAKWWSQGEIPGSNAWGAWEPVENGTGPGPWSSSRAYPGGSQVVHGGLVYQARWWTQGEAPSNPDGPWMLLSDVAPPSGLPQEFLAHLYRRQENDTTQRYDLFLTTALTTTLPPSPARWKVHVDGVEIASGSQFGLLVSDCPPPQPGAPLCQARYTWSAAATLPASAISSASRVTVWLCNAADVCRPTPQLWARFGTYF